MVACLSVFKALEFVLFHSLKSLFSEQFEKISKRICLPKEFRSEWLLEMTSLTVFFWVENWLMTFWKWFLNLIGWLVWRWLDVNQKQVEQYSSFLIHLVYPSCYQISSLFANEGHSSQKCRGLSSLAPAPPQSEHRCGTCMFILIPCIPMGPWTRLIISSDSDFQIQLHP